MRALSSVSGAAVFSEAGNLLGSHQPTTLEETGQPEWVSVGASAGDEAVELNPRGLVHLANAVIRQHEIVVPLYG